MPGVQGLFNKDSLKRIVLTYFTVLGHLFWCITSSSSLWSHSYLPERYCKDLFSCRPLSIILVHLTDRDIPTSQESDIEKDVLDKLTDVRSTDTSSLRQRMPLFAHGYISCFYLLDQSCAPYQCKDTCF